MRTLSSRSPWQRAYAAASSRGRRRSRFRCPHTLPGHLPEGRTQRNPRAGAGVQFATKSVARCGLEVHRRADLELRRTTMRPSDSSTGSSRDRSARSTGALRPPGRAPSIRGRTAGARTSPSGKGPGTGRSAPRWRGGTRTRRRQVPPGSTIRRRCRSPREVAATPASASSARESSCAASRPSSSVAERGSLHTPTRTSPAPAPPGPSSDLRFS